MFSVHASRPSHQPAIRLTPARRSRTLLSAVLLSASWGPLVPSIVVAQGEAQDVESLGIATGTRVRVIADSGDAPVVGTIADVRRDGIVFRRQSQLDTQTISYSHLADLEVSQGLHAHPITGFVVGFFGGAAVGAIYGAASYSEPKCPPMSFFCFNPITRSQTAEAGALLGALGGGIIGVITGGSIHTERWRKVPLASVLSHSLASVSVAPTAGGPRLAARFGARF